IGYNGNRDLAAQPIVEARLSTNLDPASRAQEYDATNDIWLRLPSLPTSRAGLGVVAGADGNLYAIAAHPPPHPHTPTASPKPDEDGRFRTNALGTVEAYDPATYTWATRAALPTKRSELGVAAANGKLYAIGGTSGRNLLGIPSVSNVVEEYDSASDSWRR